MKMINNMFSMFDPSDSSNSLIWYSIFILIIVTNHITKYKIRQKNELILTITKNFIYKEINKLIEPIRTKNTPVLTSNLFIIVIVINLIRINPFNFTRTAHLVVSLPIATTIWLSSIIYSIVNKIKNFIIHLTPTSTPTTLINFIVIIELVRIIIRPITLSVRLTANIVAGHLLISLISSSWIGSIKMLLIIPTAILAILEIAVRIIQAYVLSTLLTLYCKENN